jgi:hypothetical protein
MLKEIAGTPPHPRSHHTASLVEFDEEDDGEAEKKVFIIGGYACPEPTALRLALAPPDLCPTCHRPPCT